MPCGTHRKSLEKGEGFLTRYFTQEERDYLKTRRVAQSVAGMFAAKEAFLKALGVGLMGGVALSDIGVTHDERAARRMPCPQKAKDAMAGKGASVSFLSISHDAGIAAAVCVLE